MAQQFEPQQPMEGTLPQSRMDIELSAIGGWHETSQLRNEAQKFKNTKGSIGKRRPTAAH